MYIKEFERLRKFIEEHKSLIRLNDFSLYVTTNDHDVIRADGMKKFENVLVDNTIMDIDYKDILEVDLWVLTDKGEISFVK